MEPKDWIALGALVVSLGSAWTAITARNEAAELANREFTTDKTLEILGSVYSEIQASQGKPDRAKWSCYFVATLGRAEQRAQREGPYFVGGFIEDVTRAGLWPPQCAASLEDIISPEAPRATDLTPEEQVTASRAGPEEAPAQIGQWHALVASYNTTPFGCAQAREDIAHFAPTLAGLGFDGRRIYVVRTAISNNLAVTVDAGDDRALAAQISAAIRQKAPANGTGADSFVQGNRGWTIDPECTAFGTIGP